MISLLLNPDVVSVEESIHRWEACMSSPLPEVDNMFPYLISYNSQEVPVFEQNNHMMFVNSSATVPRGSPAASYNCVSYKDILTPLEETYLIDPKKLEGVISDFLISIESQQTINDNNLVDKILADIRIMGNYFPMFQSLDDNSDASHEKISARCFDNQVNKFSRISNMIVFCFDESHRSESDSSNSACNCGSVYRLLTIAQLCEAKLRNSIVQNNNKKKTQADVARFVSNSNKSESTISCSNKDKDIKSSSSNNDKAKNTAGYYDCVDDEYEEGLSVDFSSLINKLSQNSRFSEVLPNEFDNEEKLFEKRLYNITNSKSISYQHLNFKTFLLQSFINSEQIGLLKSALSYFAYYEDPELLKKMCKPHFSFELVSNIETMKISSCSYESSIAFTGEILVNSGIWFGNNHDFLSARNNKDKTRNYDQLHSNVIVRSDITIPHYSLMQNSIIFNNENSFLSKSYFDNIQKLAYKEPSSKISYINNHSIKFQVFIETKQGYSFPSFKKLNDIYEYVVGATSDPTLSNSDDLLFLKFPASGSIGTMFPFCVEDIMKILNLCRILQIIKENNTSDNIDKKNLKFPCLIYCENGYVESSLLLFIFLIYSTGLSFSQLLSEVYQNRLIAGRPFYLFDNDYLLLNQLYPILHCYGSFYSEYPLNNPKLNEIRLLIENNSNMQHLSPPLRVNKDIISKILLGNFVENSSTISSIVSTSINIISVTVPIHNSSNYSHNQLSEIHSLPSRILPNLYLGSLENASSIQTLEILGINVLVSVGENANWLKMLPSSHYTIIRKKNISIYKFNSHLEGLCTNMYRRFPVKYILSINNLKDDSIDYMSLDILKEIFDFFDKYTETDLYKIVNSNSDKILVHCQAGVSRSATIVIAYIMNYLKMGLESAFLFVKTRRLNILIQPNVKLMYVLFKFQEYLISNDQSTHNELRKIDWPIFCKNIEILKNFYTQKI